MSTTARGNQFGSLPLALLVGLLSLSLPHWPDTQQELDRAKEELADVRAELDRAAAAWHSATVTIDATRVEMAETQVRIAGLALRLRRIEDRRARRAVAAFTAGPATTMDLLLSSSSFTEFSDRLEFLGSVAQDDADLAIEEQVTQDQLRRERADLQALSERQADTAATLNDDSMIASNTFGGVALVRVNSLSTTGAASHRTRVSVQASALLVE